MARRTIEQVISGQPAIDGAGVHLTRVLGRETSREFDPFLMLDFFNSKEPDEYLKGFPMHPHRGIETITYLISGKITHKDSLGNSGTITDGEGQWMTSGSGILHQELPLESAHLFGIQLWLNLDSKSKMTTPKYNSLNSIEKIQADGASVKVISGEYQGLVGYQPDHVKARIMDIEIESSCEISIDMPMNNTVFIFLLEGEAEVEGQLLEVHAATRFGLGDSLKIEAGDSGARILYFEGTPLKEEIAWAGPIVMNTHEEIDEAFSDLRSNKFIRE